MLASKEFDDEKFVNAVLYFARNTDPESLGPLKLNKLLYYSDFLHFKKYGRPITNDRYVRMEHGPVPSTSYMIFGQTAGNLGDKPTKTVLSDKVTIKKTLYKGKVINKIEALREPDMSVFSDSEIEVLKHVAEVCRSKKLTGSKLRAATHLPDSPWSRTEENQTIDYSLILDNSQDSLSRDYVEYWQKEKEDLSEIFS